MPIISFGRPTMETLEGLGLRYVADELKTESNTIYQPDVEECEDDWKTRK